MIDGVKVVDLVTHEDDRGYLTEIARQAGAPEPHAVVHRFGQVYLVGNPARGTIRAFHNIRWIQLLEDDRKATGIPGSVLDAPPAPPPR